MATDDTCATAGAVGVVQVTCSARPDTPDDTVATCVPLYAKVIARLFASVIELIPYWQVAAVQPGFNGWPNVYTVWFLSVSVYPGDAAANVAYRPVGGLNDPSTARPKDTSCPSGYVTTT